MGIKILDDWDTRKKKVISDEPQFLKPAKLTSEEIGRFKEEFVKAFIGSENGGGQ